MGLSKKALDLLLNYDYPGNVRELENILEHALIVCTNDIIQHTHLPDYIHNRMAATQASLFEANQTVVPDNPNDDRQRILHTTAAIPRQPQ